MRNFYQPSSRRAINTMLVFQVLVAVTSAIAAINDPADWRAWVSVVGVACTVVVQSISRDDSYTRTPFKNRKTP